MENQPIILTKNEPRSVAHFQYSIRAKIISIRDFKLGKETMLEAMQAALRQIDYWHQGSITSFYLQWSR
jgi:hypothetical protein